MFCSFLCYEVKNGLWYMKDCICLLNNKVYWLYWILFFLFISVRYHMPVILQNAGNKKCAQNCCLLECGTTVSGKHTVMFWRNHLPLFSTLKMGAAGASETSVLIYQTMWHYILENLYFCGHCHENLKFHMITEFWHGNLLEACYLEGKQENERTVLKCVLGS